MSGWHKWCTDDSEGSHAFAYLKDGTEEELEVALRYARETITMVDGNWVMPKDSETEWTNYSIWDAPINGKKLAEGILPKQGDKNGCE